MLRTKDIRRHASNGGDGPGTAAEPVCDDRPRYSQIKKMRSVSARPQSVWTKLLVGLCAALILMSGTIQAAHFHRDGKIDPDCALCVTVHSIAHVVQPITVPFSVGRVEPVAPVRRIQMPRAALFFRLISRPPPAPSAFSA